MVRFPQSRVRHGIVPVPSPPNSFLLDGELRPRHREAHKELIEQEQQGWASSQAS